MSCSLVVTCWENPDFLALPCVMFSCVFVTFPHGILVQVWYLIVSFLIFAFFPTFIIILCCFLHDLNIRFCTIFVISQYQKPFCIRLPCVALPLINPVDDLSSHLTETFTGSVLDHCSKNDKIYNQLVPYL